MDMYIYLPVTVPHVRNFLENYKYKGIPVTDLRCEHIISKLIFHELRRSPKDFIPSSLKKENEVKIQLRYDRIKNVRYNFYLSKPSITLINHYLEKYFDVEFISFIIQECIDLKERCVNVSKFMDVYGIGLDSEEALLKKYYRRITKKKLK